MVALGNKEHCIQSDIAPKYLSELQATERSAGEYMVAEYCPIVIMVFEG